MLKHLQTTEFEQFWAKCPAKKAKLAAEKAFVKARKTATLEELLLGMDRYLESKPAWQEYAYPATWLNQGRWLDESVRAKSYAWHCPHDPRCKHRPACEVVSMRERT